MSLCRGCGAAIEWIRTPAGKSMPVDSPPVFVMEGQGRERFFLDTGEAIVGREATPEEERFTKDLPVAFVPHWKTCPRAADFRRRK